jgi:hypothetical protein
MANGFYSPSTGSNIAVECVGSGGKRTPITATTRCSVSGGGGSDGYRKFSLQKPNF